MIVEGLVRLINDAYAVGEAELWTAGTTRTTPDEVAELIRTGGMLTARAQGRLVGCACVRQVDASTADLGFVSTDPLRWGGGVGRRLVDTAEELMRTDDPALFEEWTARWGDLAEFEVVPVIGSAQAAARVRGGA